MPVAQGVDTSVITTPDSTPVTPSTTSSPVNAGFGDSSLTLPSAPHTTNPVEVLASGSQPSPPPFTTIAVQPTAKVLPEIEVDTAVASPVAQDAAVHPGQQPTTPAITVFPSAEKMVTELLESGVLADIKTATLNQASGQTITNTQVLPLSTPQTSTLVAIHLANTTPIFQRPTAQQLLTQAQNDGSSKYNPLWWIIVVLLALGAVGWIVYSQMRISDQSAQEVITDQVEAIIDPINL